MRYALATLCLFLAASVPAQELLKDGSALYPPAVAEMVRANVAGGAWAASVRDRVVEAAAFWMDLGEEDLWALVFSPTLERSWMVWSNGYSPVTGEPVPMYNWVADAQNHPWKMQDPTSGEWFPKNDFAAYYRSGLDERGYFQHDRADRSLLFNTEHPDPADPLHTFGVDDGFGYVNEQGHRWRFIGAYLIYGHWKQLVVAGVRVLSAAHLLTGEAAYARRAGILLDRVADVYPDFDFGKQGVMYEGPPSAGYVSTWHDACEETRELVMAYDMVFEALRDDAALATFLARKAEEAGNANPKAAWPDIQRNIESGILRHLLANEGRIHSNYPRSEILKAVTVAVLGEPDAAFRAIVDPMMERATAVDGVTGEKGMAGYASFTIAALASFLAEFSKADPAFLEDALARYPQLRDTYRFFIDTLCLQRYYPLIGDTGHFAAPVNRYVGVDFIKPGENLAGWGNWTLLAPSNFRFLWNLYEQTGDPAFAQVVYWANGNTVDGLPYDLYGGGEPAAFREALQAVIGREGACIEPPSVNKPKWHLGILRSGMDDERRALWLDYDAGGGHGHQDGLNLGLFAHGLDLLPEFGYPPVQFGGWGAPRAQWYTITAAHNTVVVDGRNQANGAGETTLWHDGDYLRAIRASAPALYGIEHYERTTALIDVDAKRFYVVDVFRVRGGSVHTKFQHSHYGPLSLFGPAPEPVERDFGPNARMRDFRLDPDPPAAWRAEWQAEDRYELLPASARVGLRHWDFTDGAAAGTCEGWMVAGSFDDSAEHWIPRLVMERRAEDGAPLESTFVAVLEPWQDAPFIWMTRRIDTGVDTEVTLEIVFEDGPGDRVIVRDSELSLTRFDPAGTEVFTEVAGAAH